MQPIVDASLLVDGTKNSRASSNEATRTRRFGAGMELENSNSTPPLKELLENYV